MPKGYSFQSASKLSKQRPSKKVGSTLWQETPIVFNFDEKQLRDDAGKRIFRTKKTRDYGAEYAMILGTKSPKVNEALKKCENLITKLCSHRFAVPFLRAVDPIALNIPDYSTIIKEPMDLGTVRRKLKEKAYKNPSQMMADIERVWSNSLTYNPVDTDIHKMTLTLQDYYMSLKPTIDNVYEDISSPVHRPSKSDYDPSYSIKIPYPGSMIDRPLNYEDKRMLTEMIKSSIILT